MITVTDLTYVVGDKKILDHISLSFKEEGVYGIIGPNGAGKSTLLKHLMKLIPVPDGTIFFDGNDINTIKVKDYAKKCSFVFQENRRDMDFTVEEMVMMGRYAYKHFWQDTEELDESIIIPILKEMGLYHIKDQAICSLSGGEAQKVFIARALVQRTPVILLDEPTSMLDIHNSVELLNLLKNIKEKYDLMIIMVIHDLNLAFGFCDTIVLLDKGGLVSFDKSENVIQSDAIESVYHHKLYRINTQHQTYIVPKLHEKK